ncbi:hypothetical protein BH24CHL4_BH24CHL4_18290 [soil metagenome]
MVLSVLQMWLGYEASDSPNAGVWHLPLGVFICAYAGGVFSHASDSSGTSGFDLPGFMASGRA